MHDARMHKDRKAHGQRHTSLPQHQTWWSVPNERSNTPAQRFIQLSGREIDVVNGPSCMHRAFPRAAYAVGLSGTGCQAMNSFWKRSL